ncbi:MAG: phytoene/squalene synthase family protein [Polyangiaceae bacterium]
MSHVTTTVSDVRREEDLAACRAVLRGGSKSFIISSLALPPRVRDPATAVYAFCRTLGDRVGGADGSTAGLADMRERLAAAYAGAPFDHAIDRAFARVVRDHALPRVLFDALVEGLSWDLDARRYGTLDALFDYAIRVGGTVVMASVILMGRRKDVVLERACDLGVAMQLTRIARDVGTDARRGRLYLPLEWCDEASVDADMLLVHPTPTPGLRDVVRRLLLTADGLYLRSDPGLSALPFDCRPAVRAARYIYAAIGHEIEQSGFDTVTRRARVSTARKLRLLGRALRASRSEQRPLAAPSLVGAADLIAQIADDPG